MALQDLKTFVSNYYGTREKRVGLIVEGLHITAVQLSPSGHLYATINGDVRNVAELDGDPSVIIAALEKHFNTLKSVI